MDFQLSFELVAILMSVALVAGFVDAIAGGGGLLTIPALLLSGMSPISALATNKLQACAGSFSASLTMVRKGLIHPRQIKLALVMAFVGSALGTISLQLINAQSLTVIIPILVAIIGIYTLFMPNLGAEPRPAKMSERTWQTTVVPVIGFYDGFFGPAVGTFFSLSNVILRGREIIQATATAKLLNFATNFASLVFFILGGKIVWIVGFCMMIGQAIGAYFGSQMVVKGGVKLIRPMIVLMCFAMLIRYTWDYWH